MSYDVIVIGGGPAGIGAAYAAATSGARTLLLERYGRLGGMAVQALVGPFMGSTESRIVEEIFARIGGRTVDFQHVDIDLFELLADKGVDILLHSVVDGVLGDGNRIDGVQAWCREGHREFRAACIIDATGDGEVAYSAGVPFEYGNDRGLTQPMSIMFTVNGIDPSRRFHCGSEEEARRVKVGERTWEEMVLAAQATGELPEHVGVVRLYRSVRSDENIVNATQVNFLHGSRSADLTRAEIEGRRQAFRILAFLRRVLPGYEQAAIAAMPAAIGVRETRRFEGIARLEKADCLAGRRRDDAAVRQASFPIDIHNPTGSGQAAGHDSSPVGTAERVKPYDIPYGVMVPRRIDGLLFTGRCISASHEALASCRVMGIAMALGAAAGTAAAVAARSGRKLREIDPAELRAFLFANP